MLSKKLLSLLNNENEYNNYYLKMSTNTFNEACTYYDEIEPDISWLEKEFNIKIEYSDNNIIITGDIRDLYEFYDEHHLEDYSNIELINKQTNKNDINKLNNKDNVRDSILENNSSIKTSTIEFLIKDEEEAIQGYEKAIQEARKSNDEPTISILQHILKEEMEHIQELKDLAANNPTKSNELNESNKLNKIN